MNTLTDLRRTLDEHADDVADPAAVARTAAVHHRIAAVRRRRQAVGGGVLALVLAAAGVTAYSARHESSALPVGPVVLGERAPGSIRSLGYAYDATGQAQVVSGSGKIRLPKSDTPRLVSWTLHDASSARFTMAGDEVHRTRATHFHDFLYLPAGQAETIAVRSAGSVGVATYAPSARVTPPGYTHDGVTYRRTVAGTPLLAAEILDHTTELTTSYVEPDGPVRIAVMCSPLPKGYVLNVSLNGHGRLSSGGGPCDSDGTFDPGASSGSEFPQRDPGRRVQVRVWISPSMHDPTPVPVTDLPGLRMGVGVYGPVDRVRLGGYDVPRTIESGGHTWSLAARDQGHTADRLALPVSAADRLAAVAWSTRGRTTIAVRVGSTSTDTGSQGGQAAMNEIWVPAGARVHVTVRRGVGTYGVAVYDRVD